MVSVQLTTLFTHHVLVPSQHGQNVVKVRERPLQAQRHACMHACVCSQLGHCADYVTVTHELLRLLWMEKHDHSPKDVNKRIKLIMCAWSLEWGILQRIKTEWVDSHSTCTECRREIVEINVTHAMQTHMTATVQNVRHTSLRRTKYFRAGNTLALSSAVSLNCASMHSRSNVSSIISNVFADN